MAAINPSTMKQLSEIIESVRPATKSFPSQSNDFGGRENMDEVYPCIFVGNISASSNIPYLKKTGITHVLNTAHGNAFGAVKSNVEKYESDGIKSLNLDLNDISTANIRKYFESSSEFIEDALGQGGKVLVHCFMGISRSATITCAFLMIKRDMTAIEALTQVRKNRWVCPNDGFLTQLADLDNELISKRKQP